MIPLKLTASTVLILRAVWNTVGISCVTVLVHISQTSVGNVWSSLGNLRTVRCGRRNILRHPTWCRGFRGRESGNNFVSRRITRSSASQVAGIMNATEELSKASWPRLRSGSHMVNPTKKAHNRKNKKGRHDVDDSRWSGTGGLQRVSGD